MVGFSAAVVPFEILPSLPPLLMFVFGVDFALYLGCTNGEEKPDDGRRGEYEA